MLSINEGTATEVPVAFAATMSQKRLGYTIGMKTAVSVPDEVFKSAERLARKSKKSRSQLFSDALREYVARHASDEVTEAMDRVCKDVGRTTDEFVSSAARRILENSEW